MALRRRDWEGESVAMRGGSSGTVLARRGLLTAAGTSVAALGVGAIVPAPAAAAANVRTVTKYVAIKWTYDPKTKITTVRKARKTTVRAKFKHGKVFQRNAKGTWARVPYVWSKKKKALVYDRALHLRLIAAATKPDPKPTDPEPTKPTAPTTGPMPSTVTATVPYVSTSMAWHLARRATFGPSPDVLADIARLGPNGWLEQQLNPSSIDDSFFDRWIGRIPHLKDTITDTSYALNTEDDFGDWDAYMNVSAAAVARALWSRRQLQAVMEDFWSNHFNVDVMHDGTAPNRANYAAMLRAKAFGKFSDLLRSVMTHPSMLIYLNNAESEAAHPNENLGRELLELHTVGVGAPYGETGVLNSARILTGLTVDDASGEFRFNYWMHWAGEGTSPRNSKVQVLGFSHPNTDRKAGLTVAYAYFDYLAHHPSTASRIARKLAVRFVTDTPTDAFVARLAAVYTANDTSIAAVLRALFNSPEFAASAGAKIHRPFERVAAAIRILGYGPDVTGTDSPRALWYQLGSTGNAPLAWEPPNGYPEPGAAWLSTAATLSSWNLRMSVILQWWPGGMTKPGKWGSAELDMDAGDLATIVFEGLTFTTDTTYGDVIDHVAKRLFGLPLASNHKAAVCTWMTSQVRDWDPKPVTPTRRCTSDDVADSWALGRWITLLLDSPYGTRR